MDAAASEPTIVHGKARMYREDRLEWVKRRRACSIHAVVTDPPSSNTRRGSSASFTEAGAASGDCASLVRRVQAFAAAALATLTAEDLDNLHGFFRKFGVRLKHLPVPVAHVFVASNPLFSRVAADALAEAELEKRRVVTRLVMTMRGDDRPKNAHEEFSGVTVMLRSMGEPWLLFRKRLEGRVQDNLRKWETGGLRRVSENKPFGDVLPSNPPRASENRLAPHPSLKPQAFLRQLVRAALPLGKGVVLDPFAGSGSTLAAANHIGYRSIGVELSARYLELAERAIRKLEAIRCPDTPSCRGASGCLPCEA